MIRVMVRGGWLPGGFEDGRWMIREKVVEEKLVRGRYCSYICALAFWISEGKSMHSSDSGSDRKLPTDLDVHNVTVEAVR